VSFRGGKKKKEGALPSEGKDDSPNGWRKKTPWRSPTKRGGGGENTVVPHRAGKRGTYFGAKRKGWDGKKGPGFRRDLARKLSTEKRSLPRGKGLRKGKTHTLGGRPKKGGAKKKQIPSAKKQCRPAWEGKKGASKRSRIETPGEGKKGNLLTDPGKKKGFLIVRDVRKESLIEGKKREGGGSATSPYAKKGGVAPTNRPGRKEMILSAQ